MTKKAVIENFLENRLTKKTKNMTKNTSMKNLYCAENKRTKTLLVTTDTNKIQTNVEFFFKAKTKKTIKLMINKVLILPLIPSNKNQFLI